MKTDPKGKSYLVVKWSAVRNQSEIETSLKMRGMSPFLFKLVQQRRTQNHAKPAHRVRRSSGQPFTGTTRSTGVGGGWVSVSDIGRVGKKMVLRCIPIYFLSTIVHDLKPKLASFAILNVPTFVCAQAETIYRSVKRPGIFM